MAEWKGAELKIARRPCRPSERSPAARPVRAKYRAEEKVGSGGSTPSRREAAWRADSSEVGFLSPGSRAPQPGSPSKKVTRFPSGS